MSEPRPFPILAQPVVFRDAFIVDGTGGPVRKGPVRVEGGRIKSIGVARLDDAEIIDCRGLVLCPGFIDAHSHSDLRLLSEPTLPMKVRQGITCEVVGQDGLSVAPVRPDLVTSRRAQLKGWLGDPLPDWTWTRVRDYLDAVKTAQPSVDVAYLVPHGSVRECVMGSDAREATESELSEMERLVEEGMEDGAVGLSTGLVYPPCCYANTEELIRLARVVGRFDGVFAAHIRNESDFVVQALEELIRVGRDAQCRVHVSHVKIAGKRNWEKLEQVLALLEGAQREVELTGDQYPYIAGSTTLAAILPPWAQAGGAEPTLKRLSDPATRRRIRDAIQDPRPAEWDNTWAGAGPEGIVVSDIPSGRRAELVGRSLAQCGNGDPLELALDLLKEEALAVSMICFSQCERVVEAFMRLPFIGVSTDGLLGARPHPRAYGTFPRVLARYVRERRVLALETALRKMSQTSAVAYRLPEVGVVEVGARANLVVFDMERVRDLASYEDPCQFPEGIVRVMRNGRFEG